MIDFEAIIWMLTLCAAVAGYAYGYVHGSRER